MTFPLTLYKVYKGTLLIYHREQVSMLGFKYKSKSGEIIVVDQHNRHEYNSSKKKCIERYISKLEREIDVMKEFINLASAL